MWTDLQQYSPRGGFQLAKGPQGDSDVLGAEVVQAAVHVLGDGVQQLGARVVGQDGKRPHDVGDGLRCEVWQRLRRP